LPHEEFTTTSNLILLLRPDKRLQRFHTAWVKSGLCQNVSIAFALLLKIDVKSVLAY
jgi:hypothetical protein